MKIRNIKTMSGLSLLLVTVLALAAAAGCATTHKARNVELTGFLGDYSQMREGTGDEAMLTYVNPKADFRRYKKIYLEPIKVYAGVGESLFGQISSEDLQKLLNYLDATLRNNLSPEYTFVTAPGPDVMRMRIALTEASSSKVALDVVSSVIPIGMAVSALKSVTLGKASAVGEAGVEFELQDSQSRQRLAAAVDRRIGSKYTGEFDKFDRWHATQAAFDHWAERLKIRLAEMRNTPGA